ncbi:MAG TPA: peptidylprolyl isomerase [Thermoanaerobaculia bacterium]
MRTNRSTAAAAAALGFLLTTAACKSSASTPTPAPATSSPIVAAASTPVPAPPPAPVAEHIKLQHILISFTGKVPGKNITRTQDEARALAHQIFGRAKKGEDFDSLVRTYTDDRAPGIYALANSGVTPGEGEFSRDRMVPAFGEVGFSLARGEIGIAEYDPVKSPYGWHVIKRLE